MADFENSVRQRTLARREQAKEAAVELPKALDTVRLIFKHHGFDFCSKFKTISGYYEKCRFRSVFRDS